jgi:hypothetical protein
MMMDNTTLAGFVAFLAGACWITTPPQWVYLWLAAGFLLAEACRYVYRQQGRELGAGPYFFIVMTAPIAYMMLIVFMFTPDGDEG